MANESESVGGGGGVGGDYDWIVEVWRMMQIISKINILARHQQTPAARQTANTRQMIKRSRDTRNTQYRIPTHPPS